MKKITLLLSLLFAFALAQKVDPQTGLKIDQGFEEVRDNCTVCHSANFIVQTKNTREEWLATIRWMQETQGLWEFDPQTEKIILDYLAKNYPQVATSRRRPPLAKELLPS